MSTSKFSPQPLIAPLQGHTDAAWRTAHARAMQPLGLQLTYYAPFARVERGEVRPRDIRALAPGLNAGYTLIPQVIFKDIHELQMLTDAIAALGYRHIDLNMGCPFGPQVKAGRGAAAAVNPGLLEQLKDFIDSRPDITFSIKMRPGLSSTDEWLPNAQLLNALTLSHITLHPRPAKLAYRGTPDLDCVTQFLSLVNHPIYYNGDITSPAEFQAIAARFPNAAGAMIGRGLLARPSLAAEIATGTEWTPEARRHLWLEIMLDVARQITDSSQGEKQALDRLKPRLEYIESHLLDKRHLKSLAKSRDLPTFLNLLTRE